MPLGILGGVVAALKVNTWIDRTIVIAGLSATVVPEFVSGIVFIMIFSIWLRVFPLTATPPGGAGALTQIYYLLMPSVPLFMILFGYIARMARAGMIEALTSDYTRTAVLKGLSYKQVIWRHVLRNALLPTITVIATQCGYLIGGLVVVETLFQLPRDRQPHLRRCQGQGLPDAGCGYSCHRRRLCRCQSDRRICSTRRSTHASLSEAGNERQRHPRDRDAHARGLSASDCREACA